MPRKEVTPAAELPPADAISTSLSDFGRPRPARDVPVGEPWIFADHRTMAMILAEELR